MCLIKTIEILEKTIYLIFDEVFYILLLEVKIYLFFFIYQENVMFLNKVSSNPQNISEYIHMCFMMKDIELRYDGGAKTTSFKRQLLIVCENILQLEMVEKTRINRLISKETYK